MSISESKKQEGSRGSASSTEAIKLLATYYSLWSVKQRNFKKPKFTQGYSHSLQASSMFATTREHDTIMDNLIIFAMTLGNGDYLGQELLLQVNISHVDVKFYGQYKSGPWASGNDDDDMRCSFYEDRLEDLVR